MCGATRVAEPLTEVADKRVFVISLRGSLWGLPRDEKETDGQFRIQVMAFESGQDAEYMAERVWVHRLKAHRWPSLVNGRLWLASAADIIIRSPSPLKVDEVELTWILKLLGKSRAGMSLLFPLDLDADEVTVQGKYMEAPVSSNEEVAWLNEMLKRNANPNRD